MKKLVFMFAAVVAMSFASCGNNTAAAEAEDTTAVDTLVEEVCDSACCDSVCADTIAE